MGSRIRWSTRTALLAKTPRRDIRSQRLLNYVMVTMRCDLFLESWSHDGDASLVSVTVGARAH